MARQLAQRIIAHAAAHVALHNGPRGTRTRSLYVRNADGRYAIDPVTLNRIPRRRAVRVDRHVFDSASLRGLLQHTPDATNPLTRRPFPRHIIARYGGMSDQERVWAAAQELGRAFLASRGPNIARMPRGALRGIETRHGVRIDHDGGEGYLYVVRGNSSAFVAHMEGPAAAPALAPAGRQVRLELYDAEGTSIRRAGVTA